MHRQILSFSDTRVRRTTLYTYIYSNKRRIGKLFFFSQSLPCTFFFSSEEYTVSFSDTIFSMLQFRDLICMLSSQELLNNKIWHHVLVHVPGLK